MVYALSVVAAGCVSSGELGMGNGVANPVAIDRLEIVSLSHRYAWGIDTLDREVLSKVFMPG